MSATILKATYRRHLQGFVGLNALLFFALFAGEDIITAIQLRQFEVVMSPKALLSFMLPLVTLVLDGLVPANTKAILVYLRRRNPLPGSRAFTKYGPGDKRVDIKALEREYGSLPVDASEQNRLWYKLFKGVEGHPSVSQAHRTSLLTRDLASLSLALAPLGTILGAVLHVEAGPWVILASVLTLQFIVLRQVAANAGRRFVTTVLAETAASID